MSAFFTEHGSIDGAISLTDCRGNRDGTLPRRENTTTSGSWTSGPEEVPTPLLAPPPADWCRYGSAKITVAPNRLS